MRLSLRGREMGGRRPLSRIVAKLAFTCDNNGMSFAMESPPIAWPSLSDLAQLLGVKLSTLSRFPGVRRRQTRRIGREVKVRPTDAVAILVERGLSEESATMGVRSVVERRSEQIPALRGPDGRSVAAPPEARLVRSDLSALSTGVARLARARMSTGPHEARLTPPDDARYAALDRMFAGRVVPLERYIYDDSR